MAATNIQNSSQRNEEKLIIKSGNIRKNRNLQFEGISKSIQPIF